MKLDNEPHEDNPNTMRTLSVRDNFRYIKCGHVAKAKLLDVPKDNQDVIIELLHGKKT